MTKPICQQKKKHWCCRTQASQSTPATPCKKTLKHAFLRTAFVIQRNMRARLLVDNIHGQLTYARRLGTAMFVNALHELSVGLCRVKCALYKSLSQSRIGIQTFYPTRCKVNTYARAHVRGNAFRAGADIELPASLKDLPIHLN